MKFTFFVAAVLAAFSLAPQINNAGSFKLRFADFTSSGQSGSAEGWQAWAPRAELQPRCYVDSAQYRSRPNALAISGNGNPAEYGGWSYRAAPIQPGRHYRFTAHYRTEAVSHEQLRVVARLDWQDASHKRVGYPDYAYLNQPTGDWNRFILEAPAPEGATQVRIELALGWSPQGTVWWDDLSLEEVAAPRPRPVRIGSVSLRPRQTGGKEGSLTAFLKALDEVALGKPDIVCLGEGITLIGHNSSYPSLAEPVPGPTTERLGVKARQYQMYIVAGVYEREGNAVYNTAVLIDRQGKVAGKYRKVYLPREEIEGGLTPGNSYPVFETDFGRIGMMICWDAQYADPARALAAQGAEIIFLPIWGGYSKLMQARALENHVYLVTAGYDCETAIFNPLGEALHSTKQSGVFKTLTVDLSQRFIEPWLGDMRGRFHKEIRWDVSAVGSTAPHP
ncbi:MAG: carbon-nitrogen hydrolase family protein [Acidobacteria bacterium]|nr:carbon-nitrogen hydrolase family protein [Acidobacteriota bacterium]MCI0721707.1 carbon-nitrogen hydrolase family protein [Acidobacteriota bacterium]